MGVIVNGKSKSCLQFPLPPGEGEFAYLVNLYVRNNPSS